MGSPGFEKKLLRALEGDDFALRMGAAAALGRARDAASASDLARLIDDSHPSVRRVAIESARERRIREAIPHLIARLDGDGSRLRTQAHDALVELTGLDHGQGETRWSAWWEVEGGSFQLPAREQALAAKREREKRRAATPTRAEATFYGVQLTSDRVVFLLDVSGSMAEAGRLERMKRETIAALEGIPDGGRFNFVFFHSEASPWSRRLVTMSSKSREAARRAVLSLRVLGGTNLHLGLKEAFRDRDVDTIVVVSDGEPSVGITQPDRILADVRRWNDLRGVVVHCIAVGWRGELLESLCAETFGEFVVTSD
jgi:Mg-chelatase subunit ChlD